MIKERNLLFVFHSIMLVITRTMCGMFCLVIATKNGTELVVKLFFAGHLWKQCFIVCATVITYNIYFHCCKQSLKWIFTWILEHPSLFPWPILAILTSFWFFPTFWNNQILILLYKIDTHKIFILMQTAALILKVGPFLAFYFRLYLFFLSHNF